MMLGIQQILKAILMMRIGWTRGVLNQVLPYGQMKTV